MILSTVILYVIQKNFQQITRTVEKNQKSGLQLQSNELLQFSNFVKLCFDEKEGAETPETFMHRIIQERNLISLFPNIAIILRIYLYLTCSNSSGERSFSKLKRIKNELRSSMSQRRLNHLPLMSIESELLRKQNCCKLIQEFACVADPGVRSEHIFGGKTVLFKVSYCFPVLSLTSF